MGVAASIITEENRRNSKCNVRSTTIKENNSSKSSSLNNRKIKELLDNQPENLDLLLAKMQEESRLRENNQYEFGYGKNNQFEEFNNELSKRLHALALYRERMDNSDK